MCGFGAILRNVIFLKAVNKRKSMSSQMVSILAPIKRPMVPPNSAEIYNVGMLHMVSVYIYIYIYDIYIYMYTVSNFNYNHIVRNT